MDGAQYTAAGRRRPWQRRAFHDRVTAMAVDIDQRLRELSGQIDRLRVLYEQHFLGIEKTLPVVPRREAEKLLAFLGNQNIGNTALRFRYLNLLRRWKLHAERWDKVVRDIENGTYKPHLVLKERREKQRGSGGAAGRPEGSPMPAPPAASPVPGMSEADLRALHQRYLDACRSLGDRREVRFEALVASLQKQVPSLLEKNHVSAVSFDVAVKEGKVILRAVPTRAEPPPPQQPPDVR